MSADKQPNPEFHQYGYDVFGKGISDLITHFIETQNSKTKKTIKSLFFGLMILVGADMFKTIMQNFIKEQQKIINEMLMNLVKGVNIVEFLQSLYNAFTGFIHNFIFYVKTIINKIFMKKQIEYQMDEMPVVKSLINETTIEIEGNKLFCESLVNYIIHDKTAKYKKEYSDKMTIDENNDVKLDINYANVDIIFDELRMQMKSLNKNGTFLSNDVFSAKNMEEFEKTIKYDKSVIIKYWDTDTQKISIGTTILFEMGDKFKCLNKYSYNKFFMITFVVMVGKSTYDEFRFACYKLKNNGHLLLYAITCNIICNQLHGQKLDVAYNNIICAFNNLTKNSLDLSTKHFYDCWEELSPNGFDYKKEFKPFIVSKIYKLLSSPTPEMTTNLNITLSSTTLLTEQLHEKFAEFVQHVKKNSKLLKNDAEVKIYTIIVKTTTTITKIENPDNVKYYDTKKRLEETLKGINPSITANDLQKEIFAKLDIEPEKTIPTSKITKSIELNETNKKYHSFDNLYLRKNQDKELYDLCYNFKNNKETRKRLGLLNKLVICLHGEAGTGKSTTINTLASMLGRDIFYVNIKGYKNEDVKMIFDYINKTHQGGGIIALEDFDAQSDVVHQREGNENNTKTVHDLMHSMNDDLTLDFILNLLDGTLTYDDSITIITTNHKNVFDKALMRRGRIDKMVEMKKCDHYQIKKMFKNFIGREIDDNILQQIKEDEFIPADIISELSLFYGKDEINDTEIMKQFL